MPETMPRPSVVVTGGRDYVPDEKAGAWLGGALSVLRPREFVHGDARGADRWAAKVAAAIGIPVVAMPADWDFHGRSAGFIRNHDLVARGDVLLAFPGGNGTEDCVRRARKAGLTVFMLGEVVKECGPRSRPAPPAPVQTDFERRRIKR